MSVLAAMRPRLDQDRTMPQRQASDSESVNTGPVSWIDAAAANWRLALDDDEAGNFNNRAKAYDDLENSLVAMGRKRSRYRNPEWTSYWGTDFEKRFGALWRDVEEARRLNPRAFADIPKTQAEFDTWAYARKGERAKDMAVAARGGFGSQIVPSLAFGISTAGSAENLPQLLLGGGTKTASEFLIAQFYAGALGTVLQTPARVRARANMGEGYSADELATDMLIGGAANAAFAGAIAYGPKVGGKLYEKAVPFDYRAAQALKEASPKHLMPPDVAAAWNVLTRHEEVASANPFVNTHEGLDAHFARIREVMDSMTAGDRLPVTPAPVTRPIAEGLGNSIERYMAAARAQESGGNDNARSSSSSAGGRYGFIDDTFVTYYRRAFPNTGLSDERILARKNQGDVQERVMRAFTEDNAAWLQRNGIEASPGNLYVVHHMGTGGAGKIFRAAADTPLAQLLTPEVMRANPHLEGMTAGSFRRWAAERMGSEPGTIAPVGDMATVRPSALDAERPLVDMPEPVAVEDIAPQPPLRPEVVNDGLFTAMRAIVDDRKISLNDMPGLARELGTDEDSLQPILQKLVDEGRLTLTKSGIYRRRMAQGPEDALTFIARRGGISYDGLDPRLADKIDSKGHDLRNSGNLNYFVPQSGPLLRPKGQGLDNMAELLWDAGYFGPPESTPRPTDTELIAWLDDAIRKKEKRYSFADQAPEPKATAADFAPPREDAPDVAADVAEQDRFWQRYDRWNEAADVAGTAPMLSGDVARLEQLLADGTDTLPPWREADLPSADELAPYVLEMVNRDIDDVLEAAYLEIEDPYYDLASEAGATAESGTGSAVDAGSARAGATDAGSGTANGRPSPKELDEIEAAGLGSPLIDEQAHAAFDDPAGDGIAQVADSAWHDVRAEVDPNIAALDRQKAQLGAEAPMRAKAEQDGTMGTPLFDAADQPTFDLGDGKGARTLKEIEDEIASDEAAIEAIKGCLL